MDVDDINGHNSNSVRVQNNIVQPEVPLIRIPEFPPRNVEPINQPNNIQPNNIQPNFQNNNIQDDNGFGEQYDSDVLNILI